MRPDPSPAAIDELHAIGEFAGVSGPAMERGTVRWFRRDLGYGFIDPAESNAEVFFHYSALDMRGFKSIDDGAEVEFIAGPGPKGVSATLVRQFPMTE